MCGIAGFVGPGDASDLSAMMSVLVHRGPDGAGKFSDSERAVFLGHQRLAILDIEGGAQPMWTRDRELCVVFNGEIYNHLALRAELIGKGRQFLTDHSDTEVLLHAYAEWGDDFVSRLNGMFAFCIYDAGRRRLFLARDRFGEKPLYYARQGDLFVFGSELTAVLRHSHLRPVRSLRHLQKYFAYGYVPAPSTLFENCYKLPGGCSLSFDLQSGNTRTTSYWQFRIEPDHSLERRTEVDLADELRELLLQAVRRRLLADVPVGLFLSGGVDSATVLACATEARIAGRIQTFTLGFNEPSFDESEAARQIAEHFGSLHRTSCLDLETAKSSICEVLSKLDEPMGDPSIIPTSLLAKFTRNHVKVALSGDGGDELFAGYDPLIALKPAAIYKSIVPQPLHKLIRSGAKMLPRSSSNMSLDFRINRTLRGLGHPEAIWNPVWLSPLEPAEMGDLFQSPLRAEDLYSEAFDYWEMGSSHHVVDRSLEFYTRFYLQEGILAKADRASMQASLESRAIFLDNDLVEFCQRLPHHYKLRGRTRKYLLKKAMTQHLPPEVLNRPKKGFGMPIASWLKSVPGEVPDYSLPGMKPEYARRAWQEHRDGKADHRLFLWSWLSLQQVTVPEPASAPGLVGAWE